MRFYSGKASILSMVFIATSMFIGCYKIYEHHLPTTVNMSFQQTGKIPLRAGLYMSDDFMHHEYEWEVEFGKHVFDLGGMLQDGGKKMVKSAFQEMVVLSSPDEAKGKKVNVVLSPYVELVEYSYTTKFQGPPVSVIVIRWTVTDAEGDIIWVKTFEGKDRFEAGKAVKPVMQYGIVHDNIRLAIEDSFRKAHKGLLSSTWWNKYNN